jgi:ABC-type antimicrobial peptide transport system permease subunit
MMYFPLYSGVVKQTGTAALVVHTAVDPVTMAVPVQQQIAAMDPALPTYDVLTMEEIVNRTTASQSFSATLLLAFAGLSLLLAGVGLYGVLSYLVTQRVAEIGIRMALGAQRSEVLRLVLFDGMRPVLLGLVLGLAGGAAAGAMIRSMLYGTSAYDPMVLAGMVGVLVGTALVACAVPALRAARIDPMRALRTE